MRTPSLKMSMPVRDKRRRAPSSRASLILLDLGRDWIAVLEDIATEVADMARIGRAGRLLRLRPPPGAMSGSGPGARRGLTRRARICPDTRSRADHGIGWQ
jgi:hypothetical protein